MKFAFYISGNSTRLNRFLDQSKAALRENISLVISDRELSECQRICLAQHGIPCAVIEYSALKGKGRKERNGILSDRILECLKKYEIDYCISFGSHILSGRLLVEYENRLINFHPAILPMYPGLAAIDQAVAHGNTFLVGNTVHFIDAGVDTGKIIMQSVIPLQAFYDSGNNYDVVLDIQVNMLQQLIQVIQDNRLKTDKNGNVRILEADYQIYQIYPKIKKLQEGEKGV